MTRLAASDFWEVLAQSVVPLFGYAFWAILGVAIVVRAIVAVARKRPKRFTTDVLDPIAGSGAVQSDLYGFTPPDSSTLVPHEAPSEPSPRQGGRR